MLCVDSNLTHCVHSLGIDFLFLGFWISSLHQLIPKGKLSRSELIKKKARTKSFAYLWFQIYSLQYPNIQEGAVKAVQEEPKEEPHLNQDFLSSCDVFMCLSYL